MCHNTHSNTTTPFITASSHNHSKDEMESGAVPPSLFAARSTYREACREARQEYREARSDWRSTRKEARQNRRARHHHHHHQPLPWHHPPTLTQPRTFCHGTALLGMLGRAIKGMLVHPNGDKGYTGVQQREHQEQVNVVGGQDGKDRVDRDVYGEKEVAQNGKKSVELAELDGGFGSDRSGFRSRQLTPNTDDEREVRELPPPRYEAVIWGAV